MQKKIKRKLSNFEKEIFFTPKSNDLKIFNVFNERSNQDHINQTFFVTNEGSIGTILGMTKEIYDYFSILEKEILNRISSNRFDYEQWRSIKVNFIRNLYLNYKSFFKFFIYFN